LFNNFCCLKQINSCLSYQLHPKKIITRANISCTPFDIHKSKLVVSKIQYVNFGKTYTYFVFFTKLDNIFWKFCFLERNTTPWDKCNIKCLNHTLSTNCNGKLFFIIKRPRSCKMSFCCMLSLLKGSFTLKKNKYYIYWNN